MTLSTQTPERRPNSNAPQFSIRVLLVMITTCAVAFAALAAQLHQYLNIAAVMILVYWTGTTLCFVGLALDRHGDSWFVPAALAEAIGLGTIVMASFTGIYYGTIFVLASVL